MRRTALLLSAALSLAVAAPANAAITVTQPLDSISPVPLTGSPESDVVQLRAHDGKIRVEDAAGVTVELPGLCAPDGPDAVECDSWGTPQVGLGGGNDDFRVAAGYSGPAPTVAGHAGDDTIEVGAAPAAHVDGGAGTDTIAFAGFTAYDGLSIDLAQGYSGSGGSIRDVERAVGSPRSDFLYGDNQANTLTGGGGNDLLDGRAGSDTLTGGEGDDRFVAADGAADTLTCLGGQDSAYVDTYDTNVNGACESWTGPGLVQPPAPVTMRPPAFYPSVPPPSYPRTPPRLVRPARGKRGVITVASRPAADASRTRIGARVRTPGQAKVRLTIRHGDRQVGTAQVATENAGEVVVNVPLDAAVKQAVAKTRHVELAAVIELEMSGATVAAEEYQATISEPPPFLRGAAGIVRRGGFGRQTLAGTPRGDRLSGESGDDTLRGKGGNDQLDGGTGNDRLEGADGNDRLDGFDGDDTLNGGAGDDLIVESRFGDDTLDGGAGNDWIVGGRGTDHITGGPGDDVIFGNSGSDTVDCGPGDDTVFVNLDSERKTARGCETILDEDDIPSIYCPEDGTEDGETLLGSDRADTCQGNGGDDDVEGAGGSDKLFGGAGDDRVFGRFGNDQLFGEAGDDELEGGRGDDRLSGGPGDDQLNGGYGRDRLDGGAGNDTLISRGGGSDQLDCGPGRDVAIADRTDRLTGCETVRRG
jgi:Ca2+-binding RTX toxin-like protein